MNIIINLINKDFIVQLNSTWLTYLVFQDYLLFRPQNYFQHLKLSEQIDGRIVRAFSNFGDRYSTLGELSRIVSPIPVDHGPDSGGNLNRILLFCEREFLQDNYILVSHRNHHIFEVGAPVPLILHSHNFAISHHLISRSLSIAT